MSYGGYGIAALGRHEFGGSASDIEPRFNQISRPVDGELDVPVTQWITYEVYYYSSSPPLTAADGLLIEISEDGGDTYADTSLAPYTQTVRVKDGQTIWIKILKTGDWPEGEEIIIRHTAPDEYGNAVSKEYPVRWP